MDILAVGEISQRFRQICGTLKPDIICDVGTRDCCDAKLLRAASSGARVFAFEANPENYFEYCAIPDVLSSGVNVQMLAISDTVGQVAIQVPHYATRRQAGTRAQRGTSSILQKASISNFVEYNVPQTTLDTFFFHILDHEPNARFALWVDVEGMAWAVARGAAKVLERTVVMKIELESKEQFRGQVLADDVVKLIEASGQRMVAHSEKSIGQFDALFVR